MSGGRRSRKQPRRSPPRGQQARRRHRWRWKVCLEAAVEIGRHWWNGAWPRPFTHAQQQQCLVPCRAEECQAKVGKRLVQGSDGFGGTGGEGRVEAGGPSQGRLPVGFRSSRSPADRNRQMLRARFPMPAIHLRHAASRVRIFQFSGWLLAGCVQREMAGMHTVHFSLGTEPGLPSTAPSGCC